jgi:hypothetical protein
VPSIVGYLGDVSPDPPNDTNAGTLFADRSTTVDVNASELNPNTFTQGGVTEFEIADPTVAVAGSGGADSPNLVLRLDTRGTTAVHVEFDARDIDGSADNAAQQIAVQYRVGSSGDYQLVPGGHFADVTTGGSATQVTPVSLTLPAAADNQPIVDVRVITTNAGGSDEWVGIDDIVASGTPTTVVVRPASLQGWSVQTINLGGADNTASADFVSGPATPPLGSGSGRLRVGADGSDAAQFRHGGSTGTLLSAIHTLAYSTYVTTQASTPNAAFLILDVDYDTNGTRDDSLFFEPKYQSGFNSALPDQGAPATGTWQRWNAADGGWYSVNGVAGSGPGTDVKSLDEIIAAEPDAQIVSATTTQGLRLVAGLGGWQGFEGNVDFVTVGTDAGTTSYDFDPPNDVVVNGTPGQDTIRICATGEDDGYYTVGTGPPVSFTDANSITVNGGDLPDSVIVDNGLATNGDCANRTMPNPAGLLAPAGGITINGGGGPSDFVGNVNGAATSGTATATALTHAKTGQTTQSITLGSIAHIRDTVSDASFEVTFSSAAGVQEVDNGPAGGDGVAAAWDPSGVLIEFGSKTAAEVDAGTGVDTVEVGPVSDTAVSDRLTIDTGGSAGESINLSDAIDLPGRDIRLLAADGAINDAHDGNDVTAGKLGVSAANVAATANPLDTAVANVEATATGAGGLHIVNTGAVTIGDVSADLRGLHASSGPVIFASVGAINLGDDAPSLLTTAIVEGQTVQLAVVAANADITSDSNRASAVSAGNISLSAPRDILLGGTGRENDVLAGGGANISAGRDFSAGYGTDVVSESASGASVTAGRHLTVDGGNTDAGATIRTNTTAPGAPLVLSAGAGATMTLRSSSPSRAVMSKSTGEVLLTADHLIVEGDSGVRAENAPVRIRPATTGNDVMLGSATDASANAVELSDTELDRFLTTALRIGRTDDVGLLINVSAAIDPADTSTLSLLAGDVIQSASIAETNLRVVVAGKYTLDNPQNSILNFAGSAGNQPSLSRVRDSSGLNIALVDGTAGLTVPASASARIEAGGPVTQTLPVAGGGGLELAGAGPYTLMNLQNAFGRLAGNTSEGVQLLSNGGAEIGAVGSTNGLTTSDDAVNVIAYDGDLRVSKNVSTGTGGVTLASRKTGGLTTLEGGAAVTSPDIDLGSDRMVLGDGTLAAGAGTVTLHPDSETDWPIDLGATDDDAGRLSLSDAELHKVTAGTLEVGAEEFGTISDPDAGVLNVSAPIAPANTGVLSLFSRGGFTRSGSGSLAEDDLRLADGSTTARTWAVKPAGVSDGGAAIPYSTPKLTVAGGDGADTFNVEPSTTTQYLIDGNAPSSGGGDKLTYDAVGGTPTGDLTPSDGFIDRSGRQRVTFQEIETVGVIGDDEDGDGAANDADNCASVANPDQANADGDAQGNACDADDDNDGASDVDEQASGTSPVKADTDDDGKADPADNCALVPNSDQLDIDSAGGGADRGHGGDHRRALRSDARGGARRARAAGRVAGRAGGVPGGAGAGQRAGQARDRDGRADRPDGRQGREDHRHAPARLERRGRRAARLADGAAQDPAALAFEVAARVGRLRPHVVAAAGELPPGLQRERAEPARRQVERARTRAAP